MKTPTSTSSLPGYNSQYEREKKKILRRNGQEDLFYEIELLRYMNLVVLERMKTEARQLSYHDYIATLRAITQSSARIAYIVKVHYQLFSPLSAVEEQNKHELQKACAVVNEIATLLLGQEQAQAINSIAFEKLAERARDQVTHEKKDGWCPSR